MKILPTQFDGQSIRHVYDEKTDTWWFSVIDVVQVLTDSENARDYWFKMKIRVKSEDGAELSPFCRQLKLPAADGKQRLTGVANAESLLRIVQSIPSPKAEPIKLWLAKVGYERMPASTLALSWRFAGYTKGGTFCSWPILIQSCQSGLLNGSMPSGSCITSMISACKLLSPVLSAQPLRSLWIWHCSAWPITVLPPCLNPSWPCHVSKCSRACKSIGRG